MPMNKILNLLVKATGETLYMVFFSFLAAYIIGIPIGVLLYITDKDGIEPHPLFNKILGTIVNLLRSVPFLILLVTIMPFTRLIVGRAIGPTATIVPLTVSAAPYIGRMVESSLKEVDRGIIEAAQSMGSSTWQIITKVLLPEARPSLMTGATISVATIIGYSAMAGFTAGGGLGDVAVQYGYYRYQFLVMILTVILLVVMVQIIQAIGSWLVRKTDHRIRN